MSRAGNVTCTGNFTMLKYIDKLSADEMERTIGFDKGRLKTGFLLVVLADDQVISSHDFELKASTRWSKGLIKSPGAHGAGTEVADLLNHRGQDVTMLKQKVAVFFARRGGNTPAKVLPNLLHTQGMKYPDAEAFGAGSRGGIPQFDLTAPRRFVILRDVSPA